MPAFSERIVIAPEVMIRNVGGESVILDLKSNRYMGLDDVGTRMWQILLESDSIQIAYDRLLDEYEVEPKQLELHLAEFVDLLIAHKLISTEGATK